MSISVRSMTVEELEKEKSKLRGLEFGGPEYDGRFQSVCNELNFRERREERIRREGIRARGNRLTKNGTEFHVKGFDQMSDESKEALEKLVDAAYKEMENE